ncbi:holliday junction DNA helicase RuvB, partial [Candidatus Hakubella thermalkaliphila]
FYVHSELKKIVLRSSEIIGVEIKDEAALEIALRSRGTPTIANGLLRRIRDFSEVKGDGAIDMKITKDSLLALDVDEKGLDDIDRKLLSTIIEKFSGGPVGVDTLSAALREDKETIEDVYEPYLLQEGFLERTPRGRFATKHAYQHLGINIPQGLF